MEAQVKGVFFFFPVSTQVSERKKEILSQKDFSHFAALTTAAVVETQQAKALLSKVVLSEDTV